MEVQMKVPRDIEDLADKLSQLAGELKRKVRKYAYPPKGSITVVAINDMGDVILMESYDPVGDESSLAYIGQDILWAINKPHNEIAY